MSGNKVFVRAQSDNLPTVNIFMVTEFFKNNECFNVAESRGVKTDRSKRENYGDSAVGYVELCREGKYCIIHGRVCPEHSVRQKPYSVTMTINEEIEDIEEAKCHDCAASEGK
ncbi:hypothetical protein ALC62_12331 [Cyphomyrmex costatus]|uniref:Uncharacterized protein n=1 Tax=Cyphomyrmex costatus TaxID=456900 RepID=A0A151IBI2_9HYME|nr:hypothetical protein ALC62_12331 [Cyphomyrmex costatus]